MMDRICLKVRGKEAIMEENDFPNVSTIIKRMFVLFVIIALFIVFFKAREYFLMIFSAIIGLTFAFLFVRLCIDVHIIANHIKNTKDKN